MSTESASVDVSSSTKSLPVPGALLVFTDGCPEYAVIEIGRDAEQTWQRGNIGRLPICDTQLSEPHVTIRWAGDHFALRDEASRNGTFINSQRVQGEGRAVHGDVLRVGRTVLLLVADVGPYRGYVEREEHLVNGQRRTFVVGPAVRRALELAGNARAEGRNLLINGETGSGKELVAARYHQATSSPGPFIAVNCAALTGNALPEVNLFGCRKGVGANMTAREGLVKAASGGVLFLDEIAELTRDVQPMLLRAIQEGQITVVGDEVPTPVDVRYVSASHQVMAARARDGLFREDLYFRLSQVQVELAPLRARREEIPWLLDLTVRQFAPELGVAARAVELALLRYWPGNVRELVEETRNAIVQARLDPRQALRAEHFRAQAGERLGSGGGAPPPAPPRAPPAPVPPSSGSAPPVARAAPVERTSPEERVPKETLLQTLEKTGWNISETARLLGEVRNTVSRLIKVYGLARPGGDEA